MGMDELKTDQTIVLRSNYLSNNYLERLFFFPQVLLSAIVAYKPIYFNLSFLTESCITFSTEALKYFSWM